MNWTSNLQSKVHWERLRPLPFLIAGFVLLTTLTVAMLMLTQRAQSDAGRALSTIAKINRISDVVTNVRRAESSQRGFLISGDTQYLTDFAPSAEAVADLLSRLRQEKFEDPPQAGLFEEFSTAAEMKISELEKNVAIARAGQRDRAVERLKANTGFRLMNQIESSATALISAERGSLATKSEGSRTFGQIVSAAGLMALILTLSIATGTLITLQRSLNKMTSTQEAMQTLNASLEQTVAQRTRNLVEANQEIQNFASTVSHDLRAPLVNIMGFSTEIGRLKKQLIENVARVSEAAQPTAGPSAKIHEIDEEIDEALDFIKTSTARMDTLISAILVIARDGSRELRPEPIDMTGLINSLADSYAHRGQQDGLKISIANLPALTSDRLAIEQIFGNLIDNAVKFLRPGVPGRIDVSARETPTHLIFEVRDNGRGIDQKDRTRVFAPFRRAGVLDRPGDGVGLAHVRSLTRLLGGSIRFSSRLGEGTTFVVELPKDCTAAAKESAVL